MKIDISPVDLFLMLSCAFRYSYGRMSYITGDCARWLVLYSPLLSTDQQKMLHKELKASLETKPHGMDMDREEWFKALDKLEEIIK